MRDESSETQDTSVDDEELPSHFRCGHAFMNSAAFELPEEAAAEEEEDEDEDEEAETGLGIKQAESLPKPSTRSRRRHDSSSSSRNSSKSSMVSATSKPLKPISQRVMAVSKPLRRASTVAKLHAVPERLSTLVASLDQVLDPIAIDHPKSCDKAATSSDSSGANPRRSSSRLSVSQLLLKRAGTMSNMQLSAAEALAERSDAPKHGDPRRAYAASLMRRCVKKTPARRKGRYIDATGIRVNVERFGWLRTPYMKLVEFGCPIAVTLLLQFLREGSVLFLLMSLVASPAAIDAVYRNLRRRQCRLLVHTAVAGSSRQAQFKFEGCGYEGVAVRDSLPGIHEAFWTGIHLLPGFGTCSEYAASPAMCERPGRASLIFCNVSSAQVISTPEIEPFVSLGSGADYCADGDAGLTGGLRLGPTLAFGGMALNTLLFLLFLLRVRRMQVLQTMASNRSEAKVKEHVYTAADFAVMITGLDKVVHEQREGGGSSKGYLEPIRMPELERRLRDDLERLGFGEEAIDHVEVARGCAREMAILTRLATLKAQRQEMLFRLAMHHEKTSRQEEAAVAKATQRVGGANDDAKATKARAQVKARAEKQREKIRAEMRTNETKTKSARRELSQLVSSDHVTTGDAFIVFQYVADRDRFVTMFRPAPRALEEGGLTELYERHVPRAVRAFISSCRTACCVAPRARTAGIGDGVDDHGAGGRYSGKEGGERPFLSAASWRAQGVSVGKAPEPNDVFWENLECGAVERRLRMWLTNVVIGLMIIAGTALLYVVKTVQVVANQHFSTFATASLETSLQALLVSAVSSVVTQVWNVVLSQSVDGLTQRERHATRSQVEVALFTKLIFVYSLNTVAVPLLVSFLTLYDPIERKPVLHIVGMTQAWYESGGAVSQAAILMVSSSVFTDLFRYINVAALFQRHVLGRFAASQIRLNQLWAPPPMPLGAVYAETFRALLLGVVYAPIYPPALLLSAFSLFSAYFSTRFAISRWWMRPPLVSGQLMKRMRSACEWLSLVGALAIGVTGVTALQGRERHSLVLIPQVVPALTAAFSFCVLLWLLGPLLNRSRYFSTRFKHEARSEPPPPPPPLPAANDASSLVGSRWQQATAVTGGLRLSKHRRSSGGPARGSLRDARMRYDEVKARCGYAIER